LSSTAPKGPLFRGAVREKAYTVSCTANKKENAFQERGDRRGVTDYNHPGKGIRLASSGLA
jgi:hypothetical protein